MQTLEKNPPQTGNKNAEMGEAHKQMVAQRLTDFSDPLVLHIAQLAYPDINAITYAQTVRQAQRPSLRKSEIGFDFANESQATQGTLDIAVKGCGGFGSLNQLAIFWLSDIMDTASLNSPAGKAFEAIAGTKGYGCDTVEAMWPGTLMSGKNFKDYGKPLQLWLGENIDILIEKALGVKPGEYGKKVLLLGMRSAGRTGEDIFVGVDAGRLADIVAKEAVREQGGQTFVPIVLEDKSICLGDMIEIKRMGGKDSAQTNKLQLIVRTRVVLNRLLNDKALLAEKKTGNYHQHLPGFVYMEKPSEQSQQIQYMNENYDGEGLDETKNNKRLWTQLSKYAIKQVVSAC
jgi:hypothetical protein